MSGWQRMFGGREWMVDGVEMVSRYEDGTRVAHRTYGEPVSVRAYWDAWEGFIMQASEETGVSPALILATICTENGKHRSAGDGSPVVRPAREEPGYQSDDLTPHRVSVGPCHLLISTARSAMGDQSIDRDWLQSVPNNLRACAHFIARGTGFTGQDPILVSARYNSGGIYDASSPTSRFHNRWHLRSYGNHLDRFADWYGDALAVMAEQSVEHGADDPIPIVPPNLPVRQLRGVDRTRVEALERACQEEGVTREDLRKAARIFARWIDEMLRDMPWYARAVAVLRGIRALLREIGR